MTPVFESVLVANRGEIARRVIRTLRSLGIRSIAVYTEPDRRSPHVAEADEALGLGDRGGYLDIERVVGAAVRAGAAALHPGYGFLAENAVLARRCAEAGVVFVGPPPAAIELMGDKINAKRAVAAAGVPVVPGRDEAGLDDSDLAAAARDLGLPVLLKPSAGGGGKGMRRVDDPAELDAAIAAARREAMGAFGDATLLVERFVTRPRHIEVQVFADTHGAVLSLGERECSLQRRHQKIVEEAPSPLLDDATRGAMGASAVATARACGYTGAGTVEFIVSADRPAEYYFMEMNTRLQVEHPVTEAVLGIDLVEWQLRVAAGEALPWSGPGGPPRPRGHAVEARVYAEDPGRGFLPASGTVLHLDEPALAHVRVDSALVAGATVSTDYDPMLAKVVAWGEDRPTALTRLRQALAATSILGVTTNVGFLGRLLGHPDVAAGHLDTELVERVTPDLRTEGRPDHVLAAAALLAAHPSGGGDPWQLGDGWRLQAPVGTRQEWRVGGEDVDVTVGVGGVAIDGAAARAATVTVTGPELALTLDGATLRYTWAVDRDTVWLGHQGDTWALQRRRETIDHAGPTLTGDGPVISPMPGVVLAVHVAAGDDVRSGQPLVTVEAMKMEHVVTAASDGTVAEVLVKPGQPVVLDQPLAVVHPGAAP